MTFQKLFGSGVSSLRPTSRDSSKSFQFRVCRSHVLTEHAAEISRPISQIGIYLRHFPKGSDYIRTVCSNPFVNLSLRAGSVDAMFSRRSCS